LHSYPFFFNTPAPASIFTLSLHDALPIFDATSRLGVYGSAVSGRSFFAVSSCGVSLGGGAGSGLVGVGLVCWPGWACWAGTGLVDRKSTRLNSSHLGISYAVFCLKKKKKK